MKPSPRRQLRGLYAITTETGHGHLAIARAALEGGARIVQLRDKSTPPSALLAIAQQMRELTRQNAALLIVNDDLSLTIQCGADGVHLGPDDATLSHARARLGADFLIGVSCGTPDEAVAAQRDGADYIGVGAIFSTLSKSDAGAPIGIEGLRHIRAQTTLPIAAIGGLNVENIGAVAQAGAEMICAISAIAAQVNAEEMTRAAQRLQRAWQEGAEEGRESWARQ